jgi:excisionase family DNA binding protein
MSDGLLSVKETAEYFGVRPRTVFKLCEQQQLPSYHIGSRRLFKREELEQWLAARRVPERIGA